MSYYKLGPDFLSAITLYPEWNFKKTQKKIESEHRLQNGALYVYKKGDYDKVSFDVEFLPNSSAALVNSWWNTNTKLQLYERHDDKIDWTFTDTVDTWTVAPSATLTASSSGVAIFACGVSESSYIKNQGSLSFHGSDFLYVKARIKSNTPVTWNGILFFSISGVNSTDFSGSFYKAISEPTGINSGFVDATWDMSALTVGTSSALWTISAISGIMINFTDEFPCNFSLDWIDIGHTYTTVSSLRLSNSGRPFEKFQKPYSTLMKGTVKLEGY